MNDQHPNQSPQIDDKGPYGGLDTTSPKLLLQGLDSLYVCYNFDLAFSEIDFVELENSKQFARNRDQAKALVDLGGERFEVLPYGQQRYPYLLSGRDFVFALAERTRPSLKVQFRSEALWRDGAQALHDRVLVWADALNVVTLKTEQVFRADWAFDFDLPVIDFGEDQFVTLARKNSKWRKGQEVQTFTLGTGQIVLRVYDKVAEIKGASGKSWFFELWGQTQNVWRVEFQVRGERLKAGGINSFSNLEDLQGDLLREIASSHTTLRIPNGDQNRSRWPLHPLWQALQVAISSMPSFGLCRHYDPRSPLSYRKRKQLHALYGQLKGIGAVMSLLSSEQKILGLDEVLARLPRALDEFHSRTLWVEEIETRIQKHETGQW